MGSESARLNRSMSPSILSQSQAIGMEPAATPTTPPRQCGTREDMQRSSRQSKSSERSTLNTLLCMEPETRGASQVRMRLHRLTNLVMGLRTVEHLCAFHAQQRLTKKVTLRIAVQPQTWIHTWSRPSSSRQPASTELIPSAASWTAVPWTCRFHQQAWVG